MFGVIPETNSVLVTIFSVNEMGKNFVGTFSEAESEQRMHFKQKFQSYFRHLSLHTPSYFCIFLFLQWQESFLPYFLQ